MSTTIEQPRRTAYDEVMYPSHSISSSDPGRMATVASLFGMKPAPVEQCRVLEIGCSDGTNLAAMAIWLPRSEFVGVDLASTRIAGGRAMVEEVGLKNLTLRHLDVMEMAPDYGVFDYIIVHGLYTWVPLEVRLQIMAICKGSLAPQGVAYISYNTLPGGHYRLMLREMMQFHIRDFKDPQQKTQQARNLLKVLANSVEKDTEPYAQFLKQEVEHQANREAETLYHDELGEVYTPLYFHQFMDEAQQHGLQFLSEADFYEMTPSGLTPKAVEILDGIRANVLLREQYLDFMRGRFFRKTLLCHQDVALNRNINPNCVRSYSVSTFARSKSETSSSEPAATEIFQNDSGAAISTADPLARAVLWQLVEKVPERIPFPRLAEEGIQRARQSLGFVPKPGDDTIADIAEFIWATYRVGLVDLHLHTPPFVTHVSEKPIASPLARWQTRRSPFVSTLHHRTLKLESPIRRAILALLDGTRDRAALRADVLEVFKSGALDLKDDNGQLITDPTILSKRIDDGLEETLETVARTAVLMG